MSESRILKYQHKTLAALDGKIGDFYLAGGTALSLFYFRHRVSHDLDFFTQGYSGERVKEIVDYLKDELKVAIKLTGSVSEKGKAGMSVYNIAFTQKDILKIDFVEDVFKLIKPTKSVEGVSILSLEDIYMRKIYAIAGAARVSDEVGRSKFAGGRQDAKDFYDLYFLSNTFMPISKFADKYCDAVMVEALIRWYRTYDRMAIIDGILSLDTEKKADYKSMEKHFKAEMDRLLDRQLGDI